MGEILNMWEKKSSDNQMMPQLLHYAQSNQKHINRNPLDFFQILMLVSGNIWFMYNSVFFMNRKANYGKAWETENVSLHFLKNFAYLDIGNQLFSYCINYLFLVLRTKVNSGNFIFHILNINLVLKIYLSFKTSLVEL